MKKLIFFMALCITCNFTLQAQVVTNTLKKMQLLHNVSYTDILKDKMSFDDSSYVETIKSQVTFVSNEPQTGGYYLLKRDSDVNIYDGGKAIWLNLRDSTYKIDKDAIGGQACRTLLYWSGEMKNWLKTPSKIKYLKDTVINKTAYNHYVVVQTDTVKNNQHVYSLIDVVSNKTTYLPFAISWRLKDFLDDGSLGGWNEEHFYSNYKLDESGFPDLSEASVPSNFKLPHNRVIPKHLSAGIIAPKINLYDNVGNTFDLEKLKGKTVLLNFTTTGCPHCVNAAQMLTRLHKKYSNTNFAIVSVYQQGANSKESVGKFDRKFNIPYPSYLTEKTAESIYHLSGYPNFYLLNKDGVIMKWYEGFYAGLENELVNELDKAQ